VLREHLCEGRHLVLQRVRVGAVHVAVVDDRVHRRRVQLGKLVGLRRVHLDGARGVVGIGHHVLAVILYALVVLHLLEVEHRRRDAGRALKLWVGLHEVRDNRRLAAVDQVEGLLGHGAVEAGAHRLALRLEVQVVGTLTGEHPLEQHLIRARLDKRLGVRVNVVVLVQRVAVHDAIGAAVLHRLGVHALLGSLGDVVGVAPAQLGAVARRALEVAHVAARLVDVTTKDELVGLRRVDR